MRGTRTIVSSLCIAVAALATSACATSGARPAVAVSSPSSTLVAGIALLDPTRAAAVIAAAARAEPEHAAEMTGYAVAAAPEHAARLAAAAAGSAPARIDEILAATRRALRQRPSVGGDRIPSYASVERLVRRATAGMPDADLVE